MKSEIKKSENEKPLKLFGKKISPFIGAIIYVKEIYEVILMIRDIDSLTSNNITNMTINFIISLIIDTIIAYLIFKLVKLYNTKADHKEFSDFTKAYYQEKVEEKRKFLEEKAEEKRNKTIEVINNKILTSQLIAAVNAYSKVFKNLNLENDKFKFFGTIVNEQLTTFNPLAKESTPVKDRIENISLTLNVDFRHIKTESDNLLKMYGLDEKEIHFIRSYKDDESNNPT